MYDVADTDKIIYNNNVMDNILSITLSLSGRTHSATKNKECDNPKPATNEVSITYDLNCRAHSHYNM